MAGLPDLLAWLDNKRRVVGRNLSDLIQNPAGAVEQMDDRVKNWNRNVEPTIQGDQLSNRPMTEDQIRQKYTDLALNAPMVGMTAWHGSPHKFDKFSLDKIGTGEGAQAYGHGLYLAEAPAVAQKYAGALSAAKATKPVGNVDLTQAYQNLPNDVPETLLAARRDFRALTDAGELSTADRRDFLTAVKNNLAASKNGQLYKTDIPDEAVARFLDWDKPLSQQSQEVQAALKNAGIDPSAHTGTGGGLISELNGRGGIPDMPWMGKGEQYLNQSGIPGIRYLDGGSRSAGQGSSNFVAFDPEMIRILERNGQATGLEPWKPGEYRLKDLIGKE